MRIIDNRKNEDTKTYLEDLKEGEPFERSNLWEGKQYIKGANTSAVNVSNGRVEPMEPLTEVRRLLKSAFIPDLDAYHNEIQEGYKRSLVNIRDKYNQSLQRYSDAISQVFDTGKEDQITKLRGYLKNYATSEVIKFLEEVTGTKIRFDLPE